jgi:predicted transcriptional regulator
MTVALTIQVPDDLSQRLQEVQDRLPEIIERGLREVQNESLAITHDEQEIIAILTSQPSPDEILAIRASPELQSRVSELLARSKDGPLSTEENAELDRYLFLEHLVRMAKGSVYQQLARKR